MAKQLLMYRLESYTVDHALPKPKPHQNTDCLNRLVIKVTSLKLVMHCTVKNLAAHWVNSKREENEVERKKKTKNALLNQKVTH